MERDATTGALVPVTWDDGTGGKISTEDAMKQFEDAMAAGKPIYMSQRGNPEDYNVD